MRQWSHLVCARTLAWLLALCSIGATPLTPAQAATLPTQIAGTHLNTRTADDGTLALEPNAPPAPAVYGAYSHFGTVLSTPQASSFFFQALHLGYTADTPAGSELRIDVRGSADGQRWTEWEVGLANGGRATFTRPVRWAQYRATLLGNLHALPSVRDIAIAPERGSALFSAMDEPVAPTWKLRATRMGMVGGHTANGHRITKRDHFVSLPSWRALSPEGTSQYTVRITYNGRSSVAPVYDVGPWNVHDDYWNADRERFKDLPQGWPEDHAAYYDGYNNGRAEKGRVRFPTAVDIGDGVWWDDLGIKGDQATVEITFLWMGRDPLAEPPPPPAPPAEAAPAPAPPPEQAAPPPAPPAEAAPAPPPAEAAPAPQPAPEAAPPPPPPPPAEFVLDTKHGGFHAQAAIKWYDGPKGCGTNGAALWTYSTPNAAESENSAVWQPALPDEALYDVYVNIPSCKSKKAATASARYFVRHRDGTQEIVIDQGKAAGQWVLLGRFPFRAGDGGSVELRDVTNDSLRTIWFDAVKWVRVP